MSGSNTSPIGYQAPEFVVFLMESIPEIEAIRLFRPPPGRPIQEDPSISESEQALIAQGLAIRKELGLPFWDSLFTYLSTHPVVPENILDRAMLHNSQDTDSVTISRGDCTLSELRKLIQALLPGTILAMSSRVSTRHGETMHLPMLDFHCAASDGNDELVRSVIQKIGLGGYVARSGRSYHFYGRALVNENSLVTILGKSMLYCPIIDRAWIAHQLLERACGLRISPGKNYQSCPIIIYEV
jgi:hypothetical protein